MRNTAINAGKISSSAELPEELVKNGVGGSFGCSIIRRVVGELPELTPLPMIVVSSLPGELFIVVGSGMTGANAIIATCTMIKKPMTNTHILMSSGRKLKITCTSFSNGNVQQAHCLPVTIKPCYGQTYNSGGIIASIFCRM